MEFKFKNLLVETEYLELRTKSIDKYEHANYRHNDQCLYVHTASIEGQQYVALSLHASACGCTFLCPK
jgi:hypothetical protein